MDNSSTHFLNGKFVKQKDLLISINDLGFTRGYAVFDYLVTYNSQKPFMLDAHIERLLNSANEIGLRISWSNGQIKEWILETINKNSDEKEKAIKIIISGGISESLDIESEPTIVIECKDRKLCPSIWYDNGVGVITVLHNRYNPEAKSNNYIEAIKQIQTAKKIGAIEPIYYNKNQVYEGSNSNIFAVLNNVLLTPKTNILHGITKNILLEILKLNVPIKVKDFNLEELMKASEVFITGSNKEVLPVTKIDGNKVGTGKVGDVTKEVISQFKSFVSSNNW